MRFDVARIARNRAQATSIAESEWKLVLERSLLGLRGEDVSFEGLERVALASQSPKQYSILVRLISQYCRSHGSGRQVFQVIDDHCDPTAFVLSEWVAALEVFSDWLESVGQAPDFLNMLNYIACCTELPDAKQPGARLDRIVADAIQQYGVQWVDDKKS